MPWKIQPGDGENIVKWLFLFLGLLTNAGASVLIKVGVSRNFLLELSLAGVMTFLKNWPLLLGIVLYGMAFLLYMVSLAKLPLTVVHPTMTAGSIALVGLAAFFLFHERFSVTTILGFAFILIGVFFTCISK